MDRDAELILWTLGVFVVAFVVARVDIWRRKKAKARKLRQRDALAWREKESLPDALDDAVIFLNEEPLSTDTPVKLGGRVDQVFLAGDNLLIPVDTKLRQSKKAEESDVIQLSVYAVMLRQRYGSQYRVSDIGYVRIVSERELDGGETAQKIHYVPVALKSEAEVVELWHRHNSKLRTA